MFFTHIEWVVQIQRRRGIEVDLGREGDGKGECMVPFIIILYIQSRLVQESLRIGTVIYPRRMSRYCLVK